MRSLFFFFTLAALHSASFAHPVADLLNRFQIPLTADQVVSIPAGTPIPIHLSSQNPYIQLYGVDQAALALGCNLYIRGSDYQVSLDGQTWGTLERTLECYLGKCSASVANATISLSLGGSQ